MSGIIYGLYEQIINGIINKNLNKEATFASSCTCLGFADFQSHYGSAPISIVWKMKESLLGFVMKKTVKV